MDEERQSHVAEQQLEEVVEVEEQEQEQQLEEGGGATFGGGKVGGGTVDLGRGGGDGRNDFEAGVGLIGGGGGRADEVG